MKKRFFMPAMFAAALLIAASSLTYAWFLNYKEDEVTFNQMTVSSTSSILVSTSQDGTFSTLLSYSFPTLAFNNVTGDGVTFKSPTTILELDHTEHNILYKNLYTSIPDTTVDWADAVPTDGSSDITEADYISMDIYFRASQKMNVYLAPTSYISPVSTTLTGEDSGNKSQYGDFSLDCIAGAARLSIVDISSDSDSQLKFIWIPNSQYELSYDPESGWSMNTEDGTPESDDSLEAYTGYYYYNSDREKNYLHPLGTVGGTYITTIGNSGQQVTQLQETETDSGIYEGHIKVNIWIEGCDREARRALSGGVIQGYLDFLATEVTK